jgi:hypothetical protein
LDGFGSEEIPAGCRYDTINIKNNSYPEQKICCLKRESKQQLVFRNNSRYKKLFLEKL